MYLMVPVVDPTSVGPSVPGSPRSVRKGSTIVPEGFKSVSGSLSSVLEVFWSILWSSMSVPEGSPEFTYGSQE